MHTNEVPFFLLRFNQINEEHVEKNNNNNNHHRSISVSDDSIPRNLLMMKDIRGYMETEKKMEKSIYRLFHRRKK